MGGRKRSAHSTAELESASDWWVIDPATETPQDPVPRALYVTADGTLHIEDAHGRVGVFPVTGPGVWPFQPTKVLSTTTGCIPIYGLE